MLGQILRVLAELGKRILTDPQYAQQLISLFHLSSTSRMARQQQEQLAFVSAHLEEFSAELREKISQYALEIDALIGACEKIHQLIMQGHASREAMAMAHRLIDDVNSGNKVLKIPALSESQLEWLDPAPLQRERDALVGLNDRLDHPNRINALPMQLLWIANDIETLPASVATALDEVVATPQRVWFASSCPKSVQPGDVFLARFGAYTEAYEAEIARRLKEVGRRAKPQLRAQKATLAPDTQVTLKVESDKWVDIDEPERFFVWDGTWQQEDFSIRVREDAPQAHSILLKFKLAVANFPLGRVLASVEIKNNRDASDRQLNKAKLANTAFASYAREDWKEVVDCIRYIESYLRGSVRFWIDQVDLIAGEQWQERLEEELRKRDVFVLFWSEYANRSEYVHWEIDQALKHKDIDSIIIEELIRSEPASTIPSKLKHLHFGHWGKLIHANGESNTSNLESE